MWIHAIFKLKSPQADDEDCCNKPSILFWCSACDQLLPGKTLSKGTHTRFTMPCDNFRETLEIWWKSIFRYQTEPGMERRNCYLTLKAIFNRLWNDLSSLGHSTNYQRKPISDIFSIPINSNNSSVGTHRLVGTLIPSDSGEVFGGAIGSDNVPFQVEASHDENGLKNMGPLASSRMKWWGDYCGS